MINQKNLNKLAWKLVKHPALYDQSLYFYAGTRCGTVGCLAGHSTLLSGVRVKEAKDFTNMQYTNAAAGFLGIENSDGYLLEIFRFAGDWPDDLYCLYYNDKPYTKVLAALYALQRLDVNGDISKDSTKVLNPLPEQIAYIQDLIQKDKEGQK